MVKDVWEYESAWSPVTSMIIGCCVKVGDIDSDGSDPDINDLIYLVQFMFQNGPEIPCMDHADMDGIPTESPDINDLIYLVQFMFQEGPPLASCPY